jgi:uncharacterized membrane protein YraQ (UPF0718 family)
MDKYILYGVTLVLVILSFVKDRQKTKKALLKAWKSFESIMPQLLGILTLVGILMALLNTQVISQLIGRSSGWLGVLAASVVGAVTLIPGFIAFPTAAILLSNGAGYMQIGAFISSLMMVGVVTMPLEIRHFGRKATFWRNGLAFCFAFVVALVIGKVMGEI